MDIKQIEYFFEILKYGSFTAAASHLYTNQSTVSRKISELENELGVELFKRNSRTLELTEGGEIFREEGEIILKHVHSLYDKTENIKAGKAGKFVIGMPFNVLGLHEKKIINLLKQTYPTLQLSFVSMTLEDINDAIENGDIDIAINFEHATRVNPEQIVKKNFFKDTLAFIINEEDELCGLDNVTIEDLGTKPLVLHKSLKPIQPDIVNHMLILQRQRKLPEPILCNNPESMVMEVSLGNGVGVLPRLLAEKNVSSHVRIIKVDGIDDAMDYVIMYNKKKVKPGTEAFIRKCIEFMNTQ